MDEQDKRHRKRGLTAWVPMIKSGMSKIPLGVVFGALVVVAAIFLTSYASTQKQVANEATNNAKTLADPVLELCAQGGPVAKALAEEGRCAVAQSVAAAPVPQTTTSDSGPSRAEIAALVQQEIAKLQLPAGQPPTAQQILDAARQVINENPELLRGPQGLPGDGPSDAEVRAQVAGAVNAWFAENADKLPAGPAGTNGTNGTDGDQGPKGDAGRGVVSSGPARAGETCVFRTIYSDGTTEDFPTREENCPALPPAPEPTDEAPPPTTDSGILGGLVN